MKCGKVAVIGRANAGKSTLINVLVGEKVSIVSPKPQTTRDRILAVYNDAGCQIVFEDTPGIYKAPTLLSARMQKELEGAAKDVDLILFLADAHNGLKKEDKELIYKFSERGCPMILAFTKTDIMPESLVPEVVSELGPLSENVVEIIAISSRKGKNIKKLLDILKLHLPEGEPLIKDDIISDKSEKFMVAEIMREKVLLKYEREIPHGIAVVVNVFEKQENGTYHISLDIVCEKQNHKAILIGKQGGALKETAAYARRDMEKFLGCKVYLEVYVRVKPDWRDRPDTLREYGYFKDAVK